jgi:hypothetical protein
MLLVEIIVCTSDISRSMEGPLEFNERSPPIPGIRLRQFKNVVAGTSHRESHVCSFAADIPRDFLRNPATNTAQEHDDFCYITTREGFIAFLHSAASIGRLVALDN